MAAADELKKNLERWKDKYFEQSESFEEEKKFAEEYASLLKKLLTRVSLAAENLSSDLDSELNNLRVAIRIAKPTDNDLAKRLERLDHLILSAEKSKQKSIEHAAISFQSMIDQLLSFNIPRLEKRGLKKLSKSASGKVFEFNDYPEALSQYAHLQAASLKKIFSEVSNDDGFIKRILRRSSGEEFKKLPLKKQESDGLIDSSVDLESEALGDEEKEIIPGYYAIASHISATLNHLLDQLSFPESVAPEVVELRERIETRLNWYELSPTLDDLANLVISVVGKGQRDFESFLLELDGRLGRVQGFLSESQQADQQRQGKNKEFDRVVRERVSEISLEVSNASDIEDLKQSISNHLDSISSEMDSFSSEDVERENKKKEEFKLMQERLNSMEHETRYIRSRLKEERSKALTDALTGLPNREAYDERLELELERWKRYRKPATLVVADIDHFKLVNDNYGHLSGDRVLQIMAKEIQQRIRKTDFVARYGGEEFVIILPETGIDVAKAVIEKTREMIGRLPFHFREEKVQITMSFGMTAFEGELQQRVLFDRADKALYQAKDANRNCVKVWSADQF